MCSESNAEDSPSLHSYGNPHSHHPGSINYQPAVASSWWAGWHGGSSFPPWQRRILCCQWRPTRSLLLRTETLLSLLCGNPYTCFGGFCWCSSSSPLFLLACVITLHCTIKLAPVVLQPKQWYKVVIAHLCNDLSLPVGVGSVSWNRDFKRKRGGNGMIFKVLIQIVIARGTWGRDSDVGNNRRKTSRRWSCDGQSTAVPKHDGLVRKPPKSWQTVACRLAIPCVIIISIHYQNITPCRRRTQLGGDDWEVAQDTWWHSKANVRGKFESVVSS